MTKHGVLTRNDHNEHLHIEDPRGYTPVTNERHPDLSLADLCAGAVDLGFTHLWILPDSGLIPDVAYVQQVRGVWDLKACTWQYKNAPADTPNLLRSLYTYRVRGNPANEGKSHEGINVIFCGEQAAWDWARDPSLSAARALAMIDFLQNALQVPVSGSPGNTGYTYLTKELKESKKLQFLGPPTTGMDDMPFAGICWDKAVKTIQFARQPTGEELACSHLVKIDKDATFPAGAKEERQGVGQVRALTGKAAQALWEKADFNPKTPGIWKLEITHAPGFMQLFPPIKSGWQTSAMVRAARDYGYEFAIERAWMFEHSEVLLRGPMEALWKIRAAPERTPEQRAAMKQVMNDLIGLFHMGELGNSPKYRPDWYAGITGSAYAMMLQNMVMFARKLDLFPLVSHVDCMVYATNTPLADLMPDNRTSLGGYKHEWDMPMTDEVRAILTSGKGSAALLQQLNAIAARQAREAAEAERMRWADDYDFIDDEDEWDDE